MEDITRLTVHELVEKLNKNELSSEKIVKAYKARIEDKEKDVKAFITTTLDEAEKEAVKADEERKSGAKSGFAGVPIGIKDNLCTNGVKTTCASKMLENFVAPYDATVVEKLKEQDIISLGKLNMDEFAMGSSTENSAMQITHNPWNLNKVPGGSSGGSAAAVAADMVPWALGSDTGGSIREPSSFCGVVGLKPTYGLVSRYGLVALASSLDQVGPITKDVTDCAMLLNLIAGHDEKDSTSYNIEKKDYTKSLKNDVKGLKIGVPKEFFGEGINAEVKAKLEEAIEKYSLRDADAFTILKTVGGLDIAGLTGVFIGAAIEQIPVVIDGVISAVAALLAETLCKGAVNYMIPSHKSRELAETAIMKKLHLDPVLDADMALGEGTGAVMMMSLLDVALGVYLQGASFANFEIEQYKRYEE